MDNRLNSRNITQPKLLIILMTAVFLYLTIGSIAYIYIQKSEALLYEQTFKQLQSINDIKSKKLFHFLNYRVADLTSMTREKAVIELTRALGTIKATSEEGTQFQLSDHYHSVIKTVVGEDRYFDSFLVQHGYLDLIIMGADEIPDVLYSVRDQSLALQENLQLGSGSCRLKTVWEQVRASGEVRITDVHLSMINQNKPIMSIAAPIRENGKMIGILILQLPDNTINEIMHYRSGMGETGESYAVGTDFLLRSDSYLEPERSVGNSFMNPEKFRIRTPASVMALQGHNAHSVIRDYRNVPVLSAYRPFDYESLHWAIISEIDVSEVEEDISRITIEILIVTAAVSLILSLFGFYIIQSVIDKTVVKPLRKSYERAREFEQIIENSLNEIYIFDKETLRFDYINRGAKANTGYTLEELQRLMPFDLKPEYDREQFEILIEPLLMKELEMLSFETVHRRKNGTTYDVEIHLQLMQIDGVEKFVAIINDVSDRNRAIAEKEHYYRMSTHDYLTAIHNRSYFEEKFTIELERARRYEQYLSLILFDIDDFKQINDQYGHDTGDRVLIQLTNFVQSKLRDSDVIARWGGEEFVILLPHTDLSAAMDKAEQLRVMIMEQAWELPIGITCSFGVVQVNLEKTVNEAFSEVDDALYRAKKSGKNRVAT